MLNIINEIIGVRATHAYNLLLYLSSPISSISVAVKDKYKSLLAIHPKKCKEK